jgi:hypothetical protein
MRTALMAGTPVDKSAAREYMAQQMATLVESWPKFQGQPLELAVVSTADLKGMLTAGGAIATMTPSMCAAIQYAETEAVDTEEPAIALVLMAKAASDILGEILEKGIPAGEEKGWEPEQVPEKKRELEKALDALHTTFDMYESSNMGS